MTILALQLDRPAPRARTGFFAQLSAAIVASHRQRAQRLALNDLMAFSPHLLNDLGITPADIAAGLESRPAEASRR
jgi:uncharacterized protein YjiS (DUF1127 family)